MSYGRYRTRANHQSTDNGYQTSAVESECIVASGQARVQSADKLEGLK